MQTATSNILDQLLGVAEVKPKSLIGNLTNDQLSGMPDAIFGEMFNSLISADGTVDPTLDPTVTVKTDDLNLLNSNKMGLLAAINSGDSKITNLEMTIEAGEADLDNDPISLLPKSSDLQKRVNNILSHSINTPVETDPLNLQQPLLVNNNGKTTFEVIESEIKAGQLNLKIMGEGFNSEIEVSVPVSSLSEEKLSNDSGFLSMKSGKQIAGLLNQRPLINQGQSKSLETLFSQLDLKQIEISVTDKADTQISNEPQLQLQIEGVKDGRPVILSGQVATSMLKANRVSKQDQSEVNASDKISPKASVDTPENLTRKTGRLPGVITDNSSQLDLSGKNLTHRTRFTLVDKVSIDPVMPNGVKGNEFATIIDSNNLQKSTELSQPKSQSVNQPVKLSIPDMNGRTINPSGQSIMIRIEPEHLGPARLNLTLKNDQLTARVIVESMPAKLAIEGSLEQLADQLSKAGVELDKIEVSLSNGESAHHFFDKRPNWLLSGQQGRSNHAHDEETEIQQVMPPRVSMPSAVQTSGSGGLNLLA